MQQFERFAPRVGRDQPINRWREVDSVSARRQEHREVVIAAAASPAPTKIAVVFATRGRAEILSNVVNALASQTRKPDIIIVSAVGSEDVGLLSGREDILTLFGSPGLARQRNRALRALPPQTDIVVFFDDDFLPHADWLKVVEQCFLQNPKISCITGHLAADGIHGPGMSFDEAARAIDRCVKAPPDYIVKNYSPHGCNMAFRCAAIDGLYFDERLVLYGWLEDRDFGGALARRGGLCVKFGQAIGTHLGAKVGRVSGRRLGYSQIVNPIYLRRKGTITTSSLAEHLLRNIVSNLVRSIRPEPHIDRRGRLRGNLQAARDLLNGIIAPERAELL